MSLESGFWIAVNWPWIRKMTVTSQFADMTSSYNFFHHMFCFSCQVWLLAQVLFNKGSTKNLEMRNTSIWVLPNIWRLGQVRDTKFGADVSNEMLLYAAKGQGYSFYRFWVIKGKPTGGGLKLPHSTQIRVKA